MERARGRFMSAMRIALLTLAVSLLASCATLNTSGMSDSCRALYNACLNSCPSADVNRRVPPGGTAMPTTQPMTDVAHCTNQCNEQARKCE